MCEHQKILNRIERLVDQLPYRSVKIEVAAERSDAYFAKRQAKAMRFYQRAVR